MPIKALFLLRVFYEVTQVTVMLTISASLDVLSQWIKVMDK